ncbi:T9SS type A sorting domain-containing protein [bacterium]|nr:T9SS type A sorting domain-containing protein [bacterium]
MVDGDFVVGFGSEVESAFINYEADDTGRAWDRTTSWDPWNETYYIRARVQHFDGGEQLIGMQRMPHELDSFEGYNVYRDGELLTTTEMLNHIDDTLPDYGSYDYQVSALYAGMESELSEALTVPWTPPIIAPENLTAELNEETGEVTLRWDHPDAGGSAAGVRTNAGLVVQRDLRADGRQTVTIDPTQSGVGELDEFLHFTVRRNNVTIAEPTSSPYVDQLPEFGSYAYMVRADYDEGESTNAGPAIVHWLDNAVGDEPGATPTSFAIANLYPNPFNPSVTVSVAVPNAQNVTLAVFDVLGREVAQMHNGVLQAGTHQFSWNAGARPAGIYFLKAVAADGRNDIKRMLYMK